MILPVVKLGTLALKTVCKPIANRLKKEAGLHPRFRQFIINIAQANHRFTTTVQRRIYGHATNVAIRPLDEEKAVQAAADLIGELFVFTVAAGAVTFEVQRSSRSEARKEEIVPDQKQERRRCEYGNYKKGVDRWMEYDKDDKVFNSSIIHLVSKIYIICVDRRHGLPGIPKCKISNHGKSS
ncbi:OPA3-like protein isoform X1 [Jatropha curcas]|uniref:OPA3-like protein isoform X1 n=1 Tax=Jatropha curcas TaxID=180498 RepID=UPI001895A8A6|nr:OPA3-like protein isoform X1 [Jatropha curcas]XP_037495745.1 OPA3-like protein isoform X1 [Jatropha curcas]